MRYPVSHETSYFDSFQATSRGANRGGSGHATVAEAKRFLQTYQTPQAGCLGYDVLASEQFFHT